MGAETQLWIDGQWRQADRLVELENPYTGETIANIGYASEADAKAAIESAKRAFSTFQYTPAWKRSEILRNAAQEIADRREELADTIAREAGKPIKAARREVDRAVETYRFSAEAARNLRGESIEMDAAPRGEHYRAYTVSRPVGVVTAITPFNFPMNLVAHKVGPAIAAGNSIVLKPAEQTPLTSLILGHIFQDAGLPDGVLNIIPGDGKELSKVLTEHEDVAFITFTGSPPVGKLIRAQAGLRKVTLELGSNSPLLIDDGFGEEELASIADQTVTGAFTYSGQVCISIQRIYVHQNVYDTFLRMLVERAGKLKMGDPTDDDTDLSALINQAAADRLSEWLQGAVDGGAKIETGGHIEGRICEPTILTDVPLDAKLNTEEAFGPIAVVSRVDSFDEAIQLANHSKYGLNAGAFTNDIHHALSATERIQAGAVLINQVPTFRVDHMPYGGVKDSGSGREGVRYAMQDMMDVKFVAFRSDILKR